MPDITMCSNSSCKLRVNCYRYRANPSKYQSYSDFHPFREDCEHFWNATDYLPTRMRSSDTVDAEWARDSEVADWDLA